MIKSKASYNDIMKAIQLIYDTAVIQTEKEAFRSDALDVLSDLKILASYTGDKNISDMLYYVSNFATGTHSNYSGNDPIKSVNVSNKYDEYLKEEYDRLHGGDKIEDGTESDKPEYDSGGNTPTDELKPPTETIPGDNTNNGNGNGSGGNTGGFMDNDNFMEDIGGMLDGSGAGKYVLCYTTDKTANNVEYHKTKITTKQYVTYENIISVLTSASRNSDLMFVEDTNAILVVYDGISCVIEKSDTLYGEAEIVKLFECFNNFGLALVKTEDLEKGN
jgi:hypothetical protein